jgi:choline dehydrogenase-like flavoprotein
MAAGADRAPPVRREFDYIVVGSGVAATLVCDRLLENNPLSSILVLEAGERIPSRNRRSWWDLVLSRATPYSRTYDDDTDGSATQESYTAGGVPWGFRESRVRAFGGSTMHWGGWALRFQEEDFECRTRTGFGADWPFGYSTLEPWYDLAEQALGVGGDHQDEGPPRTGHYPLPAYVWSAHEANLATGFESIGLKPGHMPIARFKRCITTGTCKYCPVGARYSAQDQLDALLANPANRNIELLTSAPARRLVAERNRVVGVEHFDPAAGDWVVTHGEKVIVCAGTYESTKLLLASTSPLWPAGIGNRHDQVGRYIVTHLLFSAEGEHRSNRRRLFQEYDFPTLMSRTWDNPDNQPFGKLFVFNNRALPRIDFAAHMIEGKTAAQIEAITKGKHKAGLSAFIEEFGDAENRLTIAKGEGQFKLPKTRISFSRRSPPEFMARVKATQAKLSECLKFLGYVPTEVREENPRGDHASGTCRMGLSPDASVTNGDLRVHGVDNLFVCSNAALPNAAAVNPTLTLAALALRLGTRLAVGEL